MSNETAMQKSTTYQPVYHFADESVFTTFVEKVPRSSLIDHLRTDHNLRNRYFPGYRISATSPTQQQILNAYRRDILQRGNSRLANLMCEVWIQNSANLVREALQSLGIAREHSSEVGTWLKKVHSILGGENASDALRVLVRAVSGAFSADDILIFVSIISYGSDLQKTRSLVEKELVVASGLNNPPESEMERIDQELQAAREQLRASEQSREKLFSDLANDLGAAQEQLDTAAREHNAAEQEALATEAGTEALSRQIEENRKHLIAQQEVLKSQQSRKKALMKTVVQQREKLEQMQSNHAARRKESDENRQRQADQVTALEGQLELVRAWLRDEQVQQIPQVTGPEAVKRPNEGFGNNAICYQGIQRTFRNCIVLFLRERLPRIFPSDHSQRMKKLFGENWEKAAQNAAQSRQIGGTTTVVRDDYDLLGTNHFFEIFDKFYDKLFAPEADPSSTLPRPVKSKLLGNLKTIKDGRDPLSHPVEEEVSFEEAHHLLIEAKQILVWLGYEKQGAELSTLASQLDGRGKESPSIVRRLPSEDSIYQEFVGRGTVLDELAACFSSPDSRRCLLAGDGGKGKSAVAYRFAQTLSGTPGRFQLIVWLSAKRRKFQDGRTATIDLPNFTTAEEAIDRLLNEYGATDADLKKPSDEKRRLLMEYLDSLPAFVIADDIDTVLDDYQVVSLFTHDIPHTQSAVLLTSRRDIPGIRGFVIKEFDLQEAGQFIRSRIKLYGLNPAEFSNSIISEIAKVTDGSPLYMDDLLRLTKILDVKNAVKKWQEKKGDEARKYALEREMEKLTAEAKKVLIAASITDDPISFVELENILEISEDRLYSTLNELQTLFLFPKPKIVEGEQRFQINLNTKKLVRLVESSSDLYARIERASKALAGKLPDAGQGIVRSLIRQSLLRLNSGQFVEAEAILQEAIEKYPSATDLRGFLGYAYKREGRISDARSQFEAASKLKGSRREMYLHWMKMEMSCKEWSKAISVSDKAFKTHPDFYEMRELKAYALRQAGFDFHRGIHREKAEKCWTDAVEEVKRNIKAPEELESGDRQLNGSMFSTAVICLDKLGLFRERDIWLDRWEKEHPDDPRVVRQKEFLRNKRGTFQASAF